MVDHGSGNGLTRTSVALSFLDWQGGWPRHFPVRRATATSGCSSRGNATSFLAPFANDSVLVTRQTRWCQRPARRRLLPGKGSVILRTVVEREPDRAEGAGGERQEPALPPLPVSSVPGTVPPDLRDVSFHSGVRGYDRREVDRYVQRVNRVIAELEVASSPQSAVRHALEKLGEQTSGVLQRARETADEIVGTARSEAEEMVARGRGETQEIIAHAEAEAAQIVADAEAEARERIDRVERECAALQRQAEDARAEATATVARAKSEGADIVAKAITEAQEIIVRADTQAVEHRAREEEKVAQLRSRAEEEMRSLHGDIDAIEADRRRVLGEVEELAKRLDEVAATGKVPESGPGGAPEQDTGESQPSSTEDEAEPAVAAPVDQGERR